MSDNKLYERYQRQMLLKEIGEAGQQKLLQSKVLVVGAGGLGCPALQYLAAAGVGTIGIVDDDVVALTNLHRQILFTTADIGLSKAERAAAVLEKLNTDIKINPYNFRITNQNALELIEQYDIIVDGTDNFSSRYLLNDACVLLNKPLVYAAISRFEGQVAILNCTAEDGKAVNYRDLFPVPPADNEVMNCAVAGVLGVLPGIIGSMQANETIKLITGIGQPLINRLLTYNALTNQSYELLLPPSEPTASFIPKDKTAFKNFDYDWACSSEKSSFEIDANLFDSLLSNNNVTILDVREFGEQPIVTEFSHVHIPLSELNGKKLALDGDILITFCQSGGRSLQAAKLLSDRFGNSKLIYSLRGGIAKWKAQAAKSNNTMEKD